ncbi:MAG TPA: cell division protein ZapA [Ferruginibacter sp.]|nr:cell division protein ZapA [Ferruginibacter sp.]
MPDLVPINIIIGDRSYRIKSLPSDEEVIRKTVKTINDKIIEFKTQFAGKDMQDYIAMVVIWFATQTPSESQQPVLGNDFSEMLSKMETHLDKVL